jgi:hypothetical protein
VDRVRAGPLLEAAVWLALAGAGYALTFAFDEPIALYRFGATGWPRAILLLMVVVALAQLVTRSGRLGPGATRAPGPAPAPGEPGRRAHLQRVATFALPLLYLLLLPRAGYYATTPFFLSGYMLLLGERRVRHLVGTSLLIYGLVLLAFTRLFHVPLPVGVWPGFYEFSHRFLSLIH